MKDYIIVPGRGKVRVSSEIITSTNKDNYKDNSYERTRRQVYATGNKWAIENFHATHD